MLMENLLIKVNNILFIEDSVNTEVQLRFNATNGSLNITGYVTVTVEEFYSKSSSADLLIALVKSELTKIVNK